MEIKVIGFDIFYLFIGLRLESLMISGWGRFGNIVFKLFVGFCLGIKFMDSYLIEFIKNLSAYSYEFLFLVY